MSDMPTIQLRNRWVGSVQFECGLTAEIASAPLGVRTGFAIKKAIEAHANLTHANLRGADLPGADLRSADLTGADLRGADLTHANLRGANLTHADLRGADLPGADLRGADLTGANLRSADLTGADLTGADLTGANLTGARLDKTIIADDVTTDRAPLQISGFEYPIAIWDNHAKIGCAFKSLSDWRAMTEVEAEKSDALRLFTARDAILALAAVDGRGVAAPALDLDAEADGAEGRVP